MDVYRAGLRGRPQVRPVAGDGGRPRQRKAHPRRPARRVSGYSLRGRGGDRGRRRAVRARRRVPAHRSARRHQEFVNRAADFTVNIALVRDGVPEIGVVFAPARGQMYSGLARPCRGDRGRRGVRDRKPPARCMCAPASRRSPSSPAARTGRHETDLYIRDFEAAEIVSVGSSLKFCMIASGEADLYPRFGRTMEWDTAAGDAVLRAAGGMTTTLDGSRSTYGKRGQRDDCRLRQPVLRREGHGSRQRRCRLIAAYIRRADYSRRELRDCADEAADRRR